MNLFLPSSLMKSTNQSAYFNSNGGVNYLCFGSKKSFTLQHTINWNELQRFLDENSNRFVYGFIGYDAKNSIEELTSENQDELHFPVLHFNVPEYVVKIESYQQTFIQGSPDQEITAIAKKLLDQLSIPSKETVQPFQSRISKNEYIDVVNQLKQHIQRGDIYEINFCQEYFSQDAVVKNPMGLYAKINEVTQAPFSVYLQSDDLHALCGSPERFIQKKGNKISSQPIKGTAPRGNSEEEDRQLKAELAINPKEISENVMIVDLVRNDLSKIATKGSVKVDELFGVYTFPTVHQMISTISCETSENICFSDILKATFPMGSMTGAPKVSAMKLSEQYEIFQRGLYSGTIGYILPNGDFDFNVVIRTILYNADKKHLSCGVGGAITINSDAEKEYQECETKVGRLLNALTNG
jgi:para-aminobenzoate synthetase component 1